MQNPVYKKVRKLFGKKSKNKAKKSRLNDVVETKPVLALDLDKFEHISHHVIKSKRSLMRQQRLYVLWQAVYHVRHLKEAAVEIGTYKGGSAYFIASALKHFRNIDSDMFVVDTFAGHPATMLTEEIEPHHKAGLFGDTAFDDVSNYLSVFPKLKVYAGEGTEIIGKWQEQSYSFVHLDVDTYLTTKKCIEYFISRLVSGGVMVIDDFASRKCDGVAKAFNELLPKLEGFTYWQMQTEQLVLRKN